MRTEAIDFVLEHHAFLFQHVVPPSFRFRHFCSRSYASWWIQRNEFDGMREITKAMRCEFEEDLIPPKKAKNMTNDFAHLEVGGNGLKLGYLASTRRWDIRMNGSIPP